MRISIIIPTLDEADVLGGTLRPLQSLRPRDVEVIVVDGGSADGTARLARPLADRVVSAVRGRAHQMNAGARIASGDCFVFLHADSELPVGWPALLSAVCSSSQRWGRFDVRLSGAHPLLRIVETTMNWRSRWSGVATGDQAIFVSRILFERAGGFPEIALMEDIVLSQRLKRYGAPVCLNARVATSSRRWEKNGIVRTVLLMWWLRLRFYFGADPERLARIYR